MQLYAAGARLALPAGGPAVAWSRKGGRGTGSGAVRQLRRLDGGPLTLGELRQQRRVRAAAVMATEGAGLRERGRKLLAAGEADEHDWSHQSVSPAGGELPASVLRSLRGRSCS